MKLALLTALNAARAARQAAVLVTNMTSHAQRLVLGHEVAADALAEALDGALRSGKSGVIEHEAPLIFSMCRCRLCGWW